MKPANYISINSNKRQLINSKEQYLAMKSMARGYAEELAELDRLPIVHAFCISMMSSYWDSNRYTFAAKI